MIFFFKYDIVKVVGIIGPIFRGSTVLNDQGTIIFQKIYIIKFLENAGDSLTQQTVSVNVYVDILLTLAHIDA